MRVSRRLACCRRRDSPPVLVRISRTGNQYHANAAQLPPARRRVPSMMFPIPGHQTKRACRIDWQREGFGFSGAACIKSEPVTGNAALHPSRSRSSEAPLSIASAESSERALCGTWAKLSTNPLGGRNATILARASPDLRKRKSWFRIGKSGPEPIYRETLAC